jgi:hypothetical protein
MFNSATAALNDLPKGAWIALTIIGFIAFWPVGLGILFYLIWSGKMQQWKQERWAQRGTAFGGCGPRWHSYRSSGNSAFDAYRDEQLKRLEEEQKAFAEYLDKLRRAKDQTEFDQFMTERKAPKGPDSPAASQ